MRRIVRPAALVLALATGVFATELAAQMPSGPPGGEPRSNRRAEGQADALVGIWTGQWAADDGTQGGAVEMIFAREPGLPRLVAQMTFVEGGRADTVRREGRLTRQGAFFDLVGGGTMVLTLSSGRLTGEFAGGPDVPTRFGSVELTRRG